MAYILDGKTLSKREFFFLLASRGQTKRLSEIPKINRRRLLDGDSPEKALATRWLIHCGRDGTVYAVTSA
ncbi:MAG: hypothetical protein WC314_25660 [Vulcanimicrobiota bacterium]|jgi:hypothetical protein